MVATDELPAKAAMIPWHDLEDWLQIEPFLRMSSRNIASPSRLKKLAGNIGSKIELVDAGLEDLCRSACPECEDVCCARATIWYDFRDLLFLYWFSGRLPLEQIKRKKDLTCIHLTSNGCNLPRLQRPFVCTWYLCPPQAAAHKRQQWTNDVADIKTMLQEIQVERKQLENVFLQEVLSLA